MSEIKVDTLTGKTTANDITVTVGATATQSLKLGLTKGLLNYNQITDTVTDSLNISSVSDDSTSIFTTTHINNHTDALYFPSTTPIVENGSSRGGGLFGISGDYNPVSSSASITTSTMKFESCRASSHVNGATATGGEYDRATVIVCGSLA